MGLSETLKAISSPVRRQILDSLRAGPKSAGDIAAGIALTHATVSHHLSLLKKTGLILEEKHKNFIYYHFNQTVLEEVLTWIAGFGDKKDSTH